MKQSKVRFFLALIIVLILLVSGVSCDRQAFIVDDVRANAFIESSSERQGFSLFFKLDSRSNVTTCEVSSPDGSLTWSVPIEKVSYNGTSYYGSSSFTMPSGAVLPTGDWTYNVVNRDGRVKQGSFTISFSDTEGALERAVDRSLPFFDEVSNITVL